MTKSFINTFLSYVNYGIAKLIHLWFFHIIQKLIILFYK